MAQTDIRRTPGTEVGEEADGFAGTETPVVDVDVHEMMTSIKDLVPYLEEPWRSRVAVTDGFKGPPGNSYAFPQATGVAIQDAVTDDGSPAGSKIELVQEQVLDRYGIEPAILISLFHPTEHQIQPEFATALASAYNDWVRENWLERDERLRSSITIAAQSPRDAAREIDRVASDPRFVQVILPAVAHHVFGQEYYHPIFEAAERNDVAVAFHQSGGTRTAVGLPPYYIEWHTAISQNWQSQLIGLIAHGVFDKFEELRVAMVESSWTWVPHLMWLRLQLPEPASRGPLGQAAAEPVHPRAGEILDAADGVPRKPRRPLPDVRDDRLG